MVCIGNEFYVIGDVVRITDWRMQTNMDKPRNTAESTGKFPPTPILHSVAITVNVKKELEPPAAVENTAVMKNVTLNENLIKGRNVK